MTPHPIAFCCTANLGVYLYAVDLLQQLSHDAGRSFVLFRPDDARWAHGDAPPAPVTSRSQYASPELCADNIFKYILRVTWNCLLLS